MAYKNREDRLACSRRHYLKNKNLYLIRRRAFKKYNSAKNRAFILSYLKKHPCVDCGIKDPRVLEFDHVRGKKSFNISVMVYQAMNLERIKEEIKKCQVRCANCHRIKTKFRAKKKSIPSASAN